MIFYHFLSKKYSSIFYSACASLFLSFSIVSAETVSGNGYTVDQTISPISGIVSGNGYTVQTSGQIVGGIASGNGYTLQSVFGTSTEPTVLPPIVPSGGTTSSGSGYYVLPVTSTSSVATTSPIVGKDTVLTTNGSTCATRIALSSPIDIGLKNNPEDVKKLETFLNTYEKEKLVVDGIYGKDDYLAVKRWQAKYKNTILVPMKLKKPTGTIYTSSMRQIERQTTASCGQQIIVHACPFFKKTLSYGDTGEEVKKIQQFLNIVRGEKLPTNGKYGPATLAAVKRFQRMYRKDIVSIVKLSFISGNWNTQTRMKANAVIGCDVIK
ncbi:MAG: peptidoglycan-binding protein [Candidatus Pacebacteria bacterium]|nr:peptidoglycan-binding protein [Candidatus Paceibacterota bacterium]MBP9866495.1 peptidoglycan-binding protein [Candidatus Paceibacterota bacterium]